MRMDKAKIVTARTEREDHIGRLFCAELQFRFASAVRLATTLKVQPLDLPTDWSHGRHRVKEKEIALRQDQAEYAAFFLHRTATYLMAVAMKDAIRVVVPNPKSSSDSSIKSAYQISRMIRNAFAHAPFSPMWSIDPDCRNQVFSVPRIIKFDTKGLQGQPFDWRHYGGPLALFRLCKFVRMRILKDSPKARKEWPHSQKKIIQMGDLIWQQVAIPADARRIQPKVLPDGRIPIPGCDGYFLQHSVLKRKSRAG